MSLKTGHVMLTKLLFGKTVVAKAIVLSFTSLFAFQTISNDGIAGIIGSLGSAGAAVIVVIYFIAYVRDQNKVIDAIRNDSMKMHENSQRSLEDISRKFVKRQEDLQDFFEQQLKQISVNQNEILKETIITVKQFEHTLNSIKSDIEVVLVKFKPIIGLEIKSSDVNSIERIKSKEAIEMEQK